MLTDLGICPPPPLWFEQLLPGRVGPHDTLLTSQNQQISDDNVFGTNDQNSPGGEAQLDVEYLLALAQDAPLTFYSIADL